MFINPAGSVIIACWLVFMVVWAVSAPRTKRTSECPGWQWWNFLPIVAIAILFWLVRSEIAPGLGAVVWSQTLVLGIVVDVLAVAGLATLLWARYELGRNWSAEVVFKEGHELVTTGPYAYVRHPIYSGLFLLGLATALWFTNTAALVALVVVIVGFWAKARAEETLLTKHFGEAYVAYKKRTKMLIPFIL